MHLKIFKTKFTENYSESLEHSELISTVWSTVSGKLIKQVVSSANRINLILWEMLGRSFIYKRNNREPRMNPYGTPVEISLSGDVLLIWTYWYLDDK